jgi:hypothetical protein
VLAKKTACDVARFGDATDLAEREDAGGLRLFDESAARKAPRVIAQELERARAVLVVERAVDLLQERDLGVERGR